MNDPSVRAEKILSDLKSDGYTEKEIQTIGTAIAKKLAFRKTSEDPQVELNDHNKMDFSEIRFENRHKDLLKLAKVSIQLDLGKYIAIGADEIDAATVAKTLDILKDIREENGIESWREDSAGALFLAKATVAEGTTIPKVADQFNLKLAKVRSSAKRLHRETDVKTEYLSSEVEVKTDE